MARADIGHFQLHACRLLRHCRIRRSFRRGRGGGVLYWCGEKQCAGREPRRGLTLQVVQRLSKRTFRSYGELGIGPRSTDLGCGCQGHRSPDFSSKSKPTRELYVLKRPYSFRSTHGPFRQACRTRKAQLVQAQAQLQCGSTQLAPSSTERPARQRAWVPGCAFFSSAPIRNSGKR